MTAGKSAGRWVIGAAMAATLVAGAGLGGQYVLTQRYAALTAAADRALDAGDADGAKTAARLALNARTLHAWTGIDPARADSLLRDALMQGENAVTETGTRPLPVYHGPYDMPPGTVDMAPDGSRLILLENATPGPLMQDVYALPSLRLLRRAPYFADAATGFPAIFRVVSPDLGLGLDGTAPGTRFIDTASGKPVLSDFHPPSAFGPWQVADDRHVLAAIDDPKEDKTSIVRVWNLRATPAQAFDYPIVGDDYALAADGRSLMTAKSTFSGDQAFKDEYQIWDLANHRHRLTIEAVSSRFTFSRDGRYFAVSGYDGMAGSGRTRLWDTRGYQPVGTPLPAAVFDVRTMTVLSGGHVLAIATGGAIYAYDLDDHRLLGRASDIATGVQQGIGWTGQTVEDISFDHVLHSYALNPLLSLDRAALAAAACRRWGTAAMRLTADEVAGPGYRLARDACPA